MCRASLLTTVLIAASATMDMEKCLAQCFTAGWGYYLPPFSLFLFSLFSSLLTPCLFLSSSLSPPSLPPPALPPFLFFFFILTLYIGMQTWGVERNATVATITGTSQLPSSPHLPSLPLSPLLTPSHPFSPLLSPPLSSSSLE